MGHESMTSSSGNGANGSGRSSQKAPFSTREFIAGLVDPPAGPIPDQDAAEGENIPIRGGRTAGRVGQDKTAKFIVAGVGGALVLFMMIFLFTDKARPPQRPSAQARSTTHFENKPENAAASIVPDVNMKPNPEDGKKDGQLSSTDIERTKDLKDTNNASAAQMIQHPITQTTQSGGSLAQVQPFPVDSPDWAPPPYQPANPASTAAVGQKDSELAKASLIFTLNRDDKLSAVAETESQRTDG